MIHIKDKKAIDKMRTAGRLLAEIFAGIPSFIKEGITTLDLDAYLEKKMIAVSLKPECKGYRGYRHVSCISVNDVVVHGVPSSEVVLKPGDLVKVDIVGSYKGYCADMARSFFVGEATNKAKSIVLAAQSALDKAIDKAIVGNRVSDISSCVEQDVLSSGFGVVKDFAGHGIGKRMHEEPEVPNFDTGQKGPILRAGMTLAIEPMITEGNGDVYITEDGWTVKTVDGGLAGHVEDTVLVTDNGPEILTRLDRGIVQ